MGDADTVARRALELAATYLESDSQTLADLAGGDMEVLRDAARLVQERQTHSGRTTVLSAEHLAFTLITAAYDQLRRGHRPVAER